MIIPVSKLAVLAMLSTPQAPQASWWVVEVEADPPRVTLANGHGEEREVRLAGVWIPEAGRRAARMWMIRELYGRRVRVDDTPEGAVLWRGGENANVRIVREGFACAVPCGIGNAANGAGEAQP